MLNKRFYKRTKAQQRVAIAKDVQKQIHTGMVKAKVGIYLENLNGSEDAKKGERCTACALGALFVSKYELGDCSWFYEADARELQHLLSPYFSISQLIAIEDAFEIKPRWSGIRNADDRLHAIMQNIIDHKGTFYPKVEYEVTDDES